MWEMWVVEMFLTTISTTKVKVTIVLCSQCEGRKWIQITYNQKFPDKIWPWPYSDGISNDMWTKLYNITVYTEAVILTVSYAFLDI